MAPVLAIDHLFAELDAALDAGTMDADTARKVATFLAQSRADAQRRYGHFTFTRELVAAYHLEDRDEMAVLAGLAGAVAADNGVEPYLAVRELAGALVACQRLLADALGRPAEHVLGAYLVGNETREVAASRT